MNDKRIEELVALRNWDGRTEELVKMIGKVYDLMIAATVLSNCVQDLTRKDLEPVLSEEVKELTNELEELTKRVNKMNYRFLNLKDERINKENQGGKEL